MNASLMAAEALADIAGGTALSRVGVPEIDGDHQVMIDLIEQVDRAADRRGEAAAIDTILAALVDYTEYHFSREERMLEVVGFPHAAEHKECHDRLRHRIELYVVRCGAGQADGLRAVAHFAKRGLVEHVRKEDMRYQSWCAAHPNIRQALAGAESELFVELPPSIF